MLRQARQSTANSYQPPVTYCSTTPILASFNFTMTESIYSLSTPFRVLCAILMVTAVLINIGNLPADGESTSAINGIRSTSVQELASDVPTIQSCTDKLNELDQVFDRRREARAIYSSGKDERWEWYEPESVCISEERFGSMVDERYMAFDDGPKFICGVDILAQRAQRSEGCLVYSVGSNNQIGFEKSVKQFTGCETHTFDFTLKNPFRGDEYAIFHPWGLGVDDGGVMKSLETIMQELGHQGRTIDVLKIDCEGCEWLSLPPIFDAIIAGSLKVDQLLIELHNYGDGKSFQNFFQSADRAKLRVFSKEYNSWGPKGCCVEYSLASESFLREANGYYMCPR